jgi:hypothetical protein
MNKMSDTLKISRFSVNVTSSNVSLLCKKEASLLANLQKDQFTCATGDYSDIMAIPKPTTFISVKEHLPSLELNGEWYCSPTCMLLVKDSSGQISIEYGFLAKWTDDDQLFWYEDDAIENVIGWMPYPKERPTESKSILIKRLITKYDKHDHNKNVYWSLDLLGEIHIRNPECFMPVTIGIPPLHIEKEMTIESDVYLVEYEFSTANGNFTGLSTAKLIFNKESDSIQWDNSNFYSRHSFTRDVINWKKLPIDVLAQFQK